MPPLNDKRAVHGSVTSGRKAYQAPRLCCYGGVGVITQQVAMTTSAMADGGTGQTNKTH
jgi:hypothetical protein